MEKRKSLLNGYARALEIDNLMRVCVFVPLLIHSLIPHQEPRFIIPILLPLVFLYGDKLYNTSMKAPFENKLFKIWIGFNLAMTCYYGFLQQGGVYHLSTNIYEKIESTPRYVEFHLVTSYMYSYPRILLNQPDTSQIYKSHGVAYQRKPRVHYYEEQSKTIPELIEHVQEIFKSNYNSTFEIIVALPKLFAGEFEHNIGLKYSFVTNIYPHFSAEAIGRVNLWSIIDQSFLNCFEIYDKLRGLISLNVYSISYVRS